MTTLVAAIALLCGVPIGLIAGVVLGTRMVRNRRQEEFDGGYSAVNPPPVRTIIWFGEGER